jgi:hypothetical protein
MIVYILNISIDTLLSALDLITEIIDVGMMPQADLETINGLPYKPVFPG